MSMQFGSKKVSGIKFMSDSVLADVNEVCYFSGGVKHVIWTADADDKLRFTAEEAGSTIKLDNVAGTYKTSINGTDWTDYALGTTITLTNVGDSVYFSARTTNDTCWNNNLGSKFVMTGKIKAEGNIQYLLDSTGQNLSAPDHCY